MAETNPDPTPETAEPQPGLPTGAAESNDQPTLPETLPVLPVRTTTVFPGTITPLGVTRASSRRLLDDSLGQSKIVGFFAQTDEQEEPAPENLHQVGAAGTVLKLVRQQDDSVSIIVHGLERIRLGEVTQRDPFIRARIEPLEETPGEGERFDAAVEQLRDQAQKLIQATPDAPDQARTVLMNIEDPSNLADFLIANLGLELEEQQNLLEELDVPRRVHRVHQHVLSHLERAQLQQKIQEDVQSSIGQHQRQAFLREQLKAIQRELGEEEGGGEGARQLRDRLNEIDLPRQVRDEAERELGRLEVIPPASPEYSVITTYLELIADLPWTTASEDILDLDRARRILDRDHFDLEKVKRRLIEYLAVRKLNPGGRGPILCFLGPPGVGKTSLGQSIADALGRQFARISLGGIRDEAEIRGHRRTYIGAMPGRIVQEIRRVGTNNPVMMLDELDKVGSDFRGDPASALLEVLDPRQNHQFADRYLDLPFDLSQVIFIGTANYMGTVPPALRDRMEVLELPGYTDHDKEQIAKRYLVPRQLKENGLKKSQCRWRVTGLRKVIHDYTREAGVRDLERRIGAVCRALAAEVVGAESDGKSTHVTAEVVREKLGPEQHQREMDTRTEVPGVAVGLAYTPAGGEVLFVEAASYPGTGQITLTGHIGDVMRESARAALSLFKSRADRFNYDVTQLSERDLHIHVPAGAVPKDGPSAGVAIYTALASLLLGMPVKNRVAMTGEVTLRGKVLPIGGIKEKGLAASRAGVKTIIIPSQNERDLEEVDDEVRNKCTFKPVDNVDQVLEIALGRERLKRTSQPAAVA